MREIKYRAWDKEQQWMVNDIQHAYDGMWSHSNSDEINDFFGHVSTMSSFTDDEGFVVMQYTGYGNSHDGDLYEGDIIKHLYRQFIGHGEVEELEEIVFIKDIRNLPFDESSLGFEILGNAYENPELLEENAE